MFKCIARSVAVIVTCAVAFAACSERVSSEEVAITDTLMRLFDKPGARLVVGPIAVAGNAALADWTQAALGGRALLKRRNDQWHVQLCAGDGIKQEAALLLAGISPEHARSILNELNDEETGETQERLKQIASFNGVVRMEQGAHPTGKGAHGH